MAVDENREVSSEWREGKEGDDSKRAVTAVVVMMLIVLR
jgi:hypothetical protein